MPHDVDTLIVGAGPTGLAAAYYLGLGAPDASTLLIERESHVGGGCRSHVEGGFTFDRAGHVMLSTDTEALRLYETLLGDNLHWQQRRATVHSAPADGACAASQGMLYGLPPQVLRE